MDRHRRPLDVTANQVASQVASRIGVEPRSLGAWAALLLAPSLLPGRGFPGEPDAWRSTSAARQLVAPAAQQAVHAAAGLVRRADGSPLEGATVTAFAYALGHDVVGLAGVLPAPPPATTTTDAAGSFRLPLVTDACLLVQHGDGLGALLARCTQGAPVRLLATPLGEVTLPPTALGAFVRVENGAALGWREGTELRLPAGSYRLLVRFSDGFDEHRVRLASSARVALFRSSRPPLTVRVQAEASFDLIVDDWLQTPLQPDSLGQILVWAPCAPDRAHRLTLREQGPGGALALHRSVCAEPTTVLTLPHTRWRPRALGSLVAGLVATLEGGNTDVRCLALAPIRADADGRGTAHLPIAADDTRDVVLAAGAAIASLADDGTPPARSLTVQVTDARGPVADAAIELTGTPPHVTRRSTTDARGLAIFAALPRAPCLLRLQAAEHIADPAAIDVRRLDAGSVAVRAEVGAQLVGRVTLGSSPLPAGLGVDLTLRDPTGLLAMPTRAGTVAADGRFRFGGLEPGGRFTLFASAQVRGITYSAKLHGVLADSEVELDLQSEDVPAPAVRR